MRFADRDRWRWANTWCPKGPKTLKLKQLKQRKGLRSLLSHSPQPVISHETHQAKDPQALMDCSHCCCLANVEICQAPWCFVITSPLGISVGVVMHRHKGFQAMKLTLTSLWVWDRLSCWVSMCHPSVMDGGTGEGTPFPTNLALFFHTCGSTTHGFGQKNACSFLQMWGVDFIESHGRVKQKMLMLGHCTSSICHPISSAHSYSG